MNKLLREAEKYDLADLSEKIVKRANHPDCLIEIPDRDGEILCVLTTGTLAKVIVQSMSGTESETET